MESPPRDQAERNSLKHHFGAQEHHDHVAADQEPDQSERKKDRSHQQIILQHGDFVHVNSQLL